MRGLLLSLLLGAVALTTGCPQGPTKKFPNDVNPNSGKTDSKSLVTNINHYLTDAQTRYNAALVAHPDDANELAKRIRNEAIDDALAVIDSNYQDYISSIERKRSTTDFLLDVIELGTGAATGIAKGERPNQILGIALTAFRGGRTSSELNFYKQQTTPILINKMDDNRSMVLETIIPKESSPVSEYSLKAAIRDIVEYYNGGTLVRAFTELSKTTGAQALASQTRVRNLSGPITRGTITTMDQDRVLRLLDTQKNKLAQQVHDAEAATPLPAPPAVAPPAAQAARTQALQPVRGKLETIWKNIESDGGKFDAAINSLKSNAALNTILGNIDNAPTTVSERDYLRVLFALQGALNKDLDLNRELLGILTTANP
jgi:hypothetical protein